MDLEKLEIGNWIQYFPDGFYCILFSKDPRIISVRNYKGDIIRCSNEDIFPVPLTSQKITNCGFSLTEHGYIKRATDGKIVRISKEGEKVYFLWETDAIFHDIKHIHQLQNLYFQITKEILEFSLYGVKE